MPTVLPYACPNHQLARLLVRWGESGPWLGWAAAGGRVQRSLLEVADPGLALSIPLVVLLARGRLSAFARPTGRQR